MYSYIRLMLGVIFCAASAPIFAQDRYPSRAVTMVVGFTPGSYPDVSTRFLGKKLSEFLHQPFVVENKIGASGNVSSEYVAKSKPDGYTLASAVDAQWALAPTLFKKLGFNPTEDLQPIAMFSTVPVYIIINSALPAKNFAEFVALLKANPGKYSFGTPGSATVHHLAFETLKARLGLDVVHAPYRGTSQLVPALFSNEVSIAVQTYPQVREGVAKGTLRALAVTSAERTAEAPDVPTLIELGVKDVQFALGSGVFSPAKTPMAIVDLLSAEIKKAVEDPEVSRGLAGAGAQVMYQGPTEFAATIRADIAKYAEAAAVAGLKPE